MSILSVDAFAEGQDYPPERESDRISTFKKYASYRGNKFAGLVQVDEGLDYTPRLERNAFAFVSSFWRDSVMADPPTLLYEGDENAQTFIDSIREWLFAASRNVCEDMATYGLGVFVNRREREPESIDPRYWFPVREAWDTREGDIDIISYPYSTDNANQAEPDRLYVEVTSRSGTAVIRHHKLDGQRIGERVTQDETVPRGFPVPAVFGHGEYGQSMYASISGYVAELHRRESFISLSLDRAANPHLAMPVGSYSKEEDGGYTVDLESMLIPVPDGGIMPQYIEWDARFEAQDKAITRAWRNIFQDAAISELLVSTDSNTRTPISGSAVRRLAVPTVHRLTELRQDLTDAFTAVIIETAKLSGIDLDADRIQVVWPPEFASLDDADPMLEGRGEENEPANAAA